MPFSAALLLLAAAPAQQALPPGFFASLREADRRLATIGHRLATANAPLCDRLQPGLGVAVHASGQYADAHRAAALAAFRFDAAVAVEAVVAGGPAERAGVRDDDGLVAVDGAAVPGGGEGIADRDRALDLLERGLPDGVVRLSLRRQGVAREAAVQAVPACRVRFEVIPGRGDYAGSDGRAVHLGERWFERYDDPEIAVVVAHELAHAVLRHRARLDAAKVNRGLLREVGRNGRLFRQTEREADELGVYLLANAGYDPASAARFWRTRGPELDHGLFRSRTHPSSRNRADALDAVARTIAGQATPIAPPVLAARDRPLD